jgi:hypothetical protein
MINMKKYSILMGLLAFVVGFSSCEMRDEIMGRNEIGKDAGALELGLSSIYNGVAMGRADAAVDNGTASGNFDKEDVDVNQYTLIVTNTETQEEVAKGVVADLKNQEGKIIIPLNEGNYSVQAYNYDGQNVSVSERPFFKGEQTFSVAKGISTNVDLTCKLACIEIELALTTAFTDSFKDDYTVTIDNGENASQVFDNSSIGKKYYFKTPVQKNSLNVAVKATSKEGNFIELLATVQKPENAEGGHADLAGGDSFVISLTENGATESHLSIGLTVDLTFTEQGETIEIPVENIIYDGPEEPEEGEDTDPETSITFKGLPATYTCTNGDTAIPGLQDVRILASNGIKNLNVTISGEIAGLLSMVSLPETFDICNMDDELKEKVIGLGLVTDDEYVQLHAGTCTEFTFKLGELLILVPQVVNSGNSTFNLAVSDGVNTKDGNIIVIVNPKEGE